MDLFDHPVSFVEAIRQLQARKLMPTDLGSYQLKEIAAAVRRQSMFSAHTTDAYYWIRSSSKFSRSCSRKLSSGRIASRNQIPRGM